MEPVKNLWDALMRKYKDWNNSSTNFEFSKDAPMQAKIPMQQVRYPSPTPTRVPQAPVEQVLGAMTEPTPPPTQAPTAPRSEIRGRTEKFNKAYNEQTQPNVDLIVEAANRYGILPELMLDIAAQESMLGSIDRTANHHPTAKSASGLFQFINPTWASYMQRYGDEFGRDYGVEIPASLKALTPHSDAWTNYVYSPEGIEWIDQYRMNKAINAALTARILKDRGLSNWEISRGVWGTPYSKEELAPYEK